MDIPREVTYHPAHRAIAGAALPDRGGQAGYSGYLDTMEAGMSNLRRRELAPAHGAVRA